MVIHKQRTLQLNERLVRRNIDHFIIYISSMYTILTLKLFNLKLQRSHSICRSHWIIANVKTKKK